MRSVKTYGCLVLLLLAVQMSFAKSQFDQANTCYKNKQYTQAIHLYRELLQKGDHSVSVYYNLGNCFYQLKEFPKAVLYYEKALKHDPGNEKIEHNLKLAQNKALTKIETSRNFFVTEFVRNFVREYGARVWTFVFLIVLWISVIFFIIYFNKAPGTGYFYRGSAITLLLFAVLLFFIAKDRYEEQASFVSAVVLQPNAELKAEPVQGAKTTTTIEAGNKVDLLDKDAEWYKIALPNGKEGWIDERSIVKI